jgi:adenylate cyclase
LTERQTRQRLAAILAADAVGYSRLMSADDHGTVAALEAARAVFSKQILASQGRVVDMAGDSVLAVFETAAGAVSAALAAQADLEAAMSEVAAEKRLLFRIGVHLGDIIEKTDGTIYGDGVNVAARLQALAPSGGIVISEAVRGSVKNRVAARFVDLGKQAIKNIAEPVRAFQVQATSGRTSLGTQWRRSGSLSLRAGGMQCTAACRSAALRIMPRANRSLCFRSRI